MSGSTGPISRSFSRYLREFSRSAHLFPIPRRTLPWQPILGFIQHARVPERIQILQFQFKLQVLNSYIFATFCASLIAIGPLITEIMQGVFVTFGTRWQKLTSYQVSQQILNLTSPSFLHWYTHILGL